MEVSTLLTQSTGWHNEVMDLEFPVEIKSLGFIPGAGLPVTGIISQYASRARVRLGEVCVSDDVIDMYVELIRRDISVKGAVYRHLQVCAGPMISVPHPLAILGEDFDEGLLWFSDQYTASRRREILASMVTPLMEKMALPLEYEMCLKLLRESPMAPALDDRDMHTVAHLVARANNLRVRLPHVLMARAWCLYEVKGTTKRGRLGGKSVYAFFQKMTAQRTAELVAACRHLDRHGRHPWGGEFLWSFAYRCHLRANPRAMVEPIKYNRSSPAGFDCRGTMEGSKYSRGYRALHRWIGHMTRVGFEHPIEVVAGDAMYNKLTETHPERITAALSRPEQGKYAHMARDLAKQLLATEPDAARLMAHSQSSTITDVSFYLYAAFQTRSFIQAMPERLGAGVLVGLNGTQARRRPGTVIRTGADMLMHKRCQELASPGYVMSLLQERTGQRATHEQYIEYLKLSAADLMEASSSSPARKRGRKE